MPSYQFPNTGSGINVDDHLNDFLVENDLQGLHSHVWPARQGFYTVEDDMDYFRGKWGFYFNAFVTGSDTDGSAVMFPTGAVRLVGPALTSSYAQQYEGGISGSNKVFMYEPYPSASYLATGSAGFVLKKWVTGRKWNSARPQGAAAFDINFPTYSTNHLINVPYSSSINTLYAVFERDCTLDITGAECDIKFIALLNTPAPTPAPTSAPTAAPTPSPTPAPTPSPTPAPTNAPTAAPVTPSPTAEPTAAPVTPAPVTPSPTAEPTAAPTNAPVTPAPVTPAPVTPAPVTPSPTAEPTAAPTASPTPAPVLPTGNCFTITYSSVPNDLYVRYRTSYDDIVTDQLINSLETINNGDGTYTAGICVSLTSPYNIPVFIQGGVEVTGGAYIFEQGGTCTTNGGCLTTPSPTPAPTAAPVTPSPVSAPVSSPAYAAPTSAPSETTPAPVTPSPVTPSPVSAPVTSPSYASPVTPAPTEVTPSPTTPSPVTPAPGYPAPVSTPSPTAEPTAAPVTASPTPAPTPGPTAAPVTPAPVTPAPGYPAPVSTPAPVTPSPTTPAPTEVTPAPTAEPTAAPTASPTAAPFAASLDWDCVDGQCTYMGPGIGVYSTLEECSQYCIAITPSPTAAPTSAPVTPAPTTPSPVYPAPVTASPTAAPTAAPVTPSPTASPTAAPTAAPTTPSPVYPAPVTASPTSAPTAAPVTPSPTAEPTAAPVTPSPTSAPTAAPVTPAPTASPTAAPVTPAPYPAPTAQPTASPTASPTAAPVVTYDWTCNGAGDCYSNPGAGEFTSYAECMAFCGNTPAPQAAPIYIPPPTGGTYSCDCGFGCQAQFEPCDYFCINCGDVPQP